MPFRLIAKFAVLGTLFIFLLIALAAIGGMVSERRGRLAEVEDEIASSFAGEQQILGPFLVLRVREDWTRREYNKENNTWFESPQTATREVAVYPDLLDMDTTLSVEERRRGIFKARVFQSESQLTGRITLPTLDSIRAVDGAQVTVLDTSLLLLVSDPRGLSRIPSLEWDGASPEWKAGTPSEQRLPGIHAVLKDRPGDSPRPIDFRIALHLYGMGGLHVTPIATDNRLRLKSAWPHPSFVGQFLPLQRDVRDDGFSAEWSVNGLASTARQALGKREDLQQYGVYLIDPINPYPMTDRALKYGFLFIGITFAAFFLFEVTRDLRIHPIQYGFVGFAQALFFLLLLSLSEHLPFGVSYAVATLATTGLLTYYLSAVLRSFRRGLGFGALLTALYAALYGLLQSEDNALVAGSLLLFVLLTAVMVLTRKLDWYKLTMPAPSKQA
jgi:inner membrane protein